ncbi:LOW QUALITY PROTEIN: hypothetical protein Cgig2_003719 [Carnegiea gigantea]|uniref:Reverse transcriptase zinc-binding domain-containing protein n=1 Tax=Carnegiea gigantea TaxID=171969 RepID=A0A9Q1KGS4_9CARY|nr:LOW QUALITY PROTEIN: hypothetical protein Cgig2_003719 [Carnegiea gigantea]
MLRKPASLWARVLYQKYCKGKGGTDIFMTGQNPSNSWRGITDSGIQHSIGDGCGTLFWLQRWVLGQPLVELATRPIPSILQQRTISDYWEPSSGWRWEELRGLLPEDILNRNASLQVYPEAGRNFLGKNEFGRIFHLICYTAIASSADDQEKWQVIWWIKAPQRMKFLLWVVLHGALITSKTRVKRGFTDNPNCFLCLDSSEDATRVLRTCKVAREVWQYFEKASTGVQDSRLE